MDSELERFKKEFDEDLASMSDEELKAELEKIRLETCGNCMFPLTQCDCDCPR